MIPPVIFSIMAANLAANIPQAMEPTAAILPQSWPAAFYMIAAMVISQAALWIREISKYRDFKKKNGTIEETKKAAEKAWEKADIAATVSIQTKAAVEAMRSNCATTSGMLSRAVQDNAERIFDLAKESRKKG